MAEVLPLLYLHGLSSGDFGPALEQFLGSGAGLSASAITRLTRAEWRQGPRHLMASLLTRGRCEGIVLIDDPASTQITVNGRTRPAALGEPATPSAGWPRNCSSTDRSLSDYRLTSTTRCRRAPR